MDKLISQNETMESLSDLIFDRDDDEYFTGVADAMSVVGDMPDCDRWIPCEESIPQSIPQWTNDVLLCCEVEYYGKKAKYVCIGYHVNRYEAPFNSDWCDGYGDYNEEDDEYYLQEGWYERIHNWGDYDSILINDAVVAWMPLPEAWKG